jgi:hypothetical protein
MMHGPNGGAIMSARVSFVNTTYDYVVGKYLYNVVQGMVGKRKPGLLHLKYLHVNVTSE